MSPHVRLPDLVQDSKLETEFKDGFTIHVHHLSNRASRFRAPPQRIYWLRERCIGQGGFGSVWLEKRVGQAVEGLPEVRAVKQIQTGWRKSTSGDFVRELEAIAKFSHQRYEQCFVQSLGWYECPGSLYIAMEYLELGDLHQFLRISPPLAELDCQTITSQLLEGVAFMHDNEFAHRDLKPQNILVKSQPPNPWWVKIADFGISKRTEDNLGMASTVKGTLEFMAPELLQQARTSSASPPCDPYATDIWAVGGISFLMLTKTPPFPDVISLVYYSQGTMDFPLSRLTSHGTSKIGQEFISSLMRREPEWRLNATQAVGHEWVTSVVATSADAVPRSGQSYNPMIAEGSSSTSTTITSMEEQGWTTQSFETQQDILPSTLAAPPNIPKLETSKPAEVEVTQETVVIPFRNHESWRPPTPPRAHRKVQKSDSVVHEAKAQPPQTPANTMEIIKPAKIDQLVQEEKAQTPPKPVISREVKKPVKVDRFVPFSIVQHASAVMSIAFSTNGQFIAAACHAGEINIWVAASGQQARLLKTRAAPIHSIAFSADGKYLISSMGASVVSLWAISEDWEEYMFESSHPAFCAAMSLDSQIIAFGMSGGSFIEVTSISGQRISALRGHSNRVRALKFSTDGKRLISGSDDHTIKVWDLASAECMRTLVGCTGKIDSLAISPSGDIIAAASTAVNGVMVWDARSGVLLRTLDDKCGVTAVAFSPKGNVLASSTQWGAIMLRNPRTRELHESFESSTLVNELAFSPDGKVLVTAGRDRIVERFNVEAFTKGNGEVAKADAGRAASGDHKPAKTSKAKTKTVASAPGQDINTGGMTKVVVDFEIDTLSSAIDGKIRGINHPGVKCGTSRVAGVSEDRLRMEIYVDESWIKISDFELMLQARVKSNFEIKKIKKP